MLTNLTSEEKWELFVELYEHGTDVEALKKVLPGYSEDVIKNFITRYKCRASRTRQQIYSMTKNGKQLQTLDSWIVSKLQTLDPWIVSRYGNNISYTWC